MSIELDWEKEIGEQGWPKREDQLPPRPGMPRWLGWLVIVVAAILVGAGISFWQMSNAGLRAAKADVQEALEFAHWAARQGDPELFERHLDPWEPVWRTQTMAGWEQMAAAAQDAPAPQVEDLDLDGYVANALLRWQDASTGESYLVRRWFRLVGGEWRWTRPRTQHWGNEQSESSPHLTLDFYAGDGETASAALAELDALVADACQRYGVAAEQCHFHMQWLLVGDDGLPLPLRDLPLPPLASATADAMDGSLYFANADDRDWHSNAFRQRMGEFHPGRAFVSQSRLDVLRPAGDKALPAALAGETDQPILLPTPWLYGIDAAGKPHPAWQAQVRRVLKDAVLRRAEGIIMGSAAYVDAAWALHQAILTLEQGPPTLEQLAPAGAAAIAATAPLQIPDLSSLGAALQAAPDELALAQLASLADFLQARWSQAELWEIPGALGQEAFTSRFLNMTLGIDEAAFLAEWREEQRQQADSPLAPATSPPHIGAILYPLL